MSTDIKLNKLIARASAIVKSDKLLAEELGIPQQHISNWKTGERICSPEDCARLADIANEDGHLEYVKRTILKYSGTTRGRHLQEILGKWVDDEERKQARPSSVQTAKKATTQDTKPRSANNGEAGFFNLSGKSAVFQ